MRRGRRVPGLEGLLRAREDRVALREDLFQRGILAAVSSSTDRCAGQVQATSDGALTPIHNGPHLLLDSCLVRLAEPVPPTNGAQGEVTGTQSRVHYRITESAVRRALASGLSVCEYLDQLQAVHHGPLPSALHLRI